MTYQRLEGAHPKFLILQKWLKHSNPENVYHMHANNHNVLWNETKNSLGTWIYYIHVHPEDILTLLISALWIIWHICTLYRCPEPIKVYQTSKSETYKQLPACVGQGDVKYCIIQGLSQVNECWDIFWTPMNINTHTNIPVCKFFISMPTLGFPLELICIFSFGDEDINIPRMQKKKKKKIKRNVQCILMICHILWMREMWGDLWGVHIRNLMSFWFKAFIFMKISVLTMLFL